MIETVEVTVRKLITYTIVMTTVNRQKMYEDLLDEVIEAIQDGYGTEQEVLWQINEVEEL
jgi:hypothetical protein